MTAPHNETFGTQEYYAAELRADTPWRRLAAARDLANKAADNFQRRLEADYDSTLGVNKADTTDDDDMIREVKNECERLRQDLITSLEFPSKSTALEAEDHLGQSLSPLSALFAIATVEDTDLFLDIATPENPFSLSDQMHNLKDGVWDRYSFDINDPDERARALQAIYTESRNNQTLFRSQIS